MRPGTDPRVEEPEVWDMFTRTREGTSVSEDVHTWLRTKRGERVEVDSTIRWNEPQRRWDIVSIASIIVTQPWARHSSTTVWERLERINEHMHDLALRVEDQYALAANDADARELRSQVREVVNQELLERAFGGEPVEPRRRRRRRDGRTGRPPLHTDPVELVRQIGAIMLTSEDFWNTSVPDVLAQLNPPIKSHTTLKNKLVKAGRMRKEDSLIATLHRIGHEALSALDESR